MPSGVAADLRADAFGRWARGGGEERSRCIRRSDLREPIGELYAVWGYARRAMSEKDFTPPQLERLRRAFVRHRESNNLTWKELAQRLGVKPPSISRFVSGGGGIKNSRRRSSSHASRTRTSIASRDLRRLSRETGSLFMPQPRWLQTNSLAAPSTVRRISSRRPCCVFLA